MINLEHVFFEYGEDTQSAHLSDISLHVRRGECVVLAGRSGCGKTTLTRVINGLCPQFFPGTFQGTYYLDGQPASELAIDEIGTIVGSVFQDPRSQFFASNTTDELVLSMENHAFPRELMQERVAEVSNLVQVDRLLNRSIFPLSSGEKQQIAVSSVCAVKPQVLVLDEPTANLDSSVIRQLSELLLRLKEQGVTIILSEHRLHYVRDIFDRLVVLEEGRILREFTRKQALELSPEEMRHMGLRLFEEPSFEVRSSVSPAQNDFLQCESLMLSFSGNNVLCDVSLNSNTGHVLAIAGKNGAGKSSLCRVIAGLYRQNTGTVKLGCREMRKRERIKETFFVQQDADYQLYTATVEDEFFVGRKRNSASLTHEHILGYLEDIGLAECITRNPLSLSGGQKQRLLLALASSWNKDLLIFDEPTSGLDGENLCLTAKLFKELAARGKCIILITHDSELISLAADSLLYMEKGEVAYHRYV